ncbi:hypothetical protein KAM380_098950 [Aeromonas caviae]|nr:curli production assembly/transport component CsgG [Pseudomonas putida HB3267]GJB85430.1 hypothetical protein KAM380_098950 [Aeromonas caviae]
MFKFIEFKKLLEAEVGYTTNEPAQLCVLSAIEASACNLVFLLVVDLVLFVIFK